MVIYGSEHCPDCVECMDCCRKRGISFTFEDISENLASLKKFLKLRDEHSIFQPIKEMGNIGIPCIVTTQGEIVLDWESYIK